MHIVRFQSPSTEGYALRALQKKVGDSVIIIKEHEYVITDSQKETLDNQAIGYKYIKEVS